MRGPGTQWLTEASSPSCVLLKADRPLDHSTHSSLCVFVQGEFAQLGTSPLLILLVPFLGSGEHGWG